MSVEIVLFNIGVFCSGCTIDIEGAERTLVLDRAEADTGSPEENEKELPTLKLAVSCLMAPNAKAFFANGVVDLVSF